MGDNKKITKNKMTKKEYSEKTDHDLLIQLDTKFDALSMDVKEMNDGLRTRMRESEISIREIQIVMDKVNPLETYKDFIKLKETVNRWKYVGVGISATIGFVLANIGRIIDFFKKGW